MTSSGPPRSRGKYNFRSGGKKSSITVEAGTDTSRLGRQKPSIEMKIEAPDGRTFGGDLNAVRPQRVGTRVVPTGVPEDSAGAFIEEITEIEGLQGMSGWEKAAAHGYLEGNDDYLDCF